MATEASTLTVQEKAIWGAVILLAGTAYLASVLVCGFSSWSFSSFCSATLLKKPVGWLVVFPFWWGGRLVAPWFKARATLTARQRALRITSDDGEVYKHLGNAYATLGRYHEAAAAYREARRLVPDDLEAICGLGIAYLGLGDEWGAWTQLGMLELCGAKAWAQQLSDHIAQYRKSATKNQ